MLEHVQRLEDDTSQLVSRKTKKTHISQTNKLMNKLQCSYGRGVGGRSFCTLHDFVTAFWDKLKWKYNYTMNRGLFKEKRTVQSPWNIYIENNLPILNYRAFRMSQSTLHGCHIAIMRHQFYAETSIFQRAQYNRIFPRCINLHCHSIFQRPRDSSSLFMWLTTWSNLCEPHSVSSSFSYIIFTLESDINFLSSANKWISWWQRS